MFFLGSGIDIVVIVVIVVDDVDDDDVVDVIVVVDLVKRLPMMISSLKSVLTQPRTSPPKFPVR